MSATRWVQRLGRITSILTVLTPWAAGAQGFFEFRADLSGSNVVPPGSTEVTGVGLFTLSGNNFTYDVSAFSYTGWRAQIFGPTGPGTNAPSLFDLVRTSCRPPLPPYDRGGCRYQGSVSLPSEQVPDLLAGLWYVQISFDAFYSMRGQIEAVPEPSAIFFLTIVSVVPLIARFRLRRGRPGRAAAFKPRATQPGPCATAHIQASENT